MPTRTITPDTVNPDGSRTLHLKRCCNGCGAVLGDIASHDVDARGNLTDVRGECANCRPLVALEAAGCRTWQLTRRSITETTFARWKRYAAPAWGTDADGKRVLNGLEFTAGPGHEPVTVLWGDWIVRHSDGHFTVHRAPADPVGPVAGTA
jgi:hypothetical protein